MTPVESKALTKDADIDIQGGKVIASGVASYNSMVDLEARVTIDLVKVLEVAASKTKTDLDDKAIPYLKAILAMLEQQ